MGDSAEYFHCGEIIVSCSPNYKDQYFLKCIECDEYFSALEDFMTHHQSCHNDIKSEHNYSPVSLQLDESGSCEFEETEALEEAFEEVRDEGECLTLDANEECKAEDESPESDEENELKDEDDSEREDDRECNEAAQDPLEETLVDNEEWHLDKEVDNDDYSESGEELEPDDCKFRQFVCDFLKSEANLIAFIAAYKRQTQLWNRELFPKKIRSRKERAIYLEKIVAEMKSKRNVDMTNDLVSAVIKRIRQDYREKIKRLKSNEQRGISVKSKTVPAWYSDKLEFLEPFLDNYSILKLDSQRSPLKPEQIIQILNIYKRFPHLWNTNLVENVCTNKRVEALGQMSKVLNAELGIKVNENALKKYLQGIHGHFCIEKGGIITKKGNVPKNISAYYDHMIFLHDHVGPFICSDCGRRHKNPLYLKVHENQCHGGDPLKCPLCDKKYGQVEPYIAHARRHMNDVSEKCNECGKMFMRAADLRIHMRGHNGIKPYFCDTCGMSFTMPSSLAEHKRRHDKLYKVYCSICSKGFYSSDKLRTHMLSHSNIRNFACKTCGKAFKTKKTLRAHEYTHEEGRNHPCPLCGKMYKNKIGVNQHLRTHRSNVETSSNPFMES